MRKDKHHQKRGKQNSEKRVEPTTRFLRRFFRFWDGFDMGGGMLILPTTQIRLKRLKTRQRTHHEKPIKPKSTKNLM